MPSGRGRLLELATLIALIGLSFLAAAIGGVVTTSNIQTWYASLRKPTWTPPDWVFGPIWSCLYLTMSVAAWLAWRRRREKPLEVRNALACWTFQLILNAAWSWIFFGLHRPGLALVEIASLWLMIAATAASFETLDRRAAYLMLPYLAWVGFATALNSEIYRLN